jgi:carbon monoxide dehydrogenase subunit G
MPTVKETVSVSAPVDQVFEFVADHPERATAFIPGLNRIDNVAPAEAGAGQAWEYEFNWFGLVISGRSRCTKLERPRTYQFKTETGSRSTWTYSFEPGAADTRLTLVVDYDVPENMLARFAAQGVLEKMNQDRAAEALKNLKVLLEQ